LDGSVALIMQSATTIAEHSLDQYPGPKIIPAAFLDGLHRAWFRHPSRRQVARSAARPLSLKALATGARPIGTR
jgi:hypothetical protein